MDPGKEPEQIEIISGSMAGQVAWLKSCQILQPGHAADGAITRQPGQGWVTPYFSNFAASAMLLEPSCQARVKRYLNWYLRHLQENGTIKDYVYEQDLSWKTMRPDSEDAYAGTFLSLVAAYHDRTGDTGWLEENLTGLKKVARVIIRLMDHDGLSIALEDYRVKYLMDNCEAHRGLADFAGLLALLADREAPRFKTRANFIARGIEKHLWNQRKGLYHPYKTGWFKHPVNPKKFYPDATCQIFPALYGLIKPGSVRSNRLYKKLNEHQPGWVQIKPPDYPWVILGYYASLHGDCQRARDKIIHVYKTCIDASSANWYCAEAAFYVMTCFSLLNQEGLY